MAELYNLQARATDSNGAPVAGAKLYFYETGTTTLAPIYTSSALTVEHPNPVTADSGGKFAPIYLDTANTYRAVLKTADGTSTLEDIDPCDSYTNTMLDMNINSSATSTLFVRPSINVADGTMFKSATPDFANDKPLEFIGSTLLFEPSTKVAINPTPNSFAQGLAITQSVPTSGSVGGPFYFNVIEATIRSALTTGGIPGNPGSGTWTGFQCSVNAGGVNYDGDSVMGGSFGVVQTLADTSLGDKNGLSSGVVIDAFTLGKGYGGSSGATVGPDGSCPAMFGYETDVIIESENVDHVVGFNSWTGGSKVGIYTHAAYAIGAAGGMGQNGNGVAGWQTGFRLYTQGGLTNEPMAADGSLFDSDHDATLAYIFDFNNVLVTEDVIRLNNNAIRLTGAGALSLNTPIAGLGVGKAATSSAWIATDASTTTKAALNLASGAAPTSPNNGDIWFDGTHLYCRIGGVTKQLDN